MTSWYVVQTQARSEDRAKWNLENQGFRCFLPRFRKIRKHARRVETVLEPLFPRYLFAQFDADVTRWLAINGTRGVTNLLTDGRRPLSVPSEIVEKLMAETDDDGITSLSALGLFWKGRHVKIKSGPFSGQMGEVANTLAKGHDRVQVMLSILGTQANLQIPSYSLEPC